MKKSKQMLANAVIAGAVVLQSSVSHAQPPTDGELVSNELIHPFKVHMPNGNR